MTYLSPLQNDCLLSLSPKDRRCVCVCVTVCVCVCVKDSWQCQSDRKENFYTQKQDTHQEPSPSLPLSFSLSPFLCFSLSLSPSLCVIHMPRTERIPTPAAEAQRLSDSA